MPEAPTPSYPAANRLPRVLDESDASEMATLHARSITPNWPETDMFKHCQTDLCLGIGTPLTGFAIIRHAADQAEILTIVTDPDRRRAGLGRIILQKVHSYLRQFGVTIIFLEVAEDNQAAIALYRTCGYQQFGRRPAYYRRKNGRVAALTFRKTLDA